MLRLRAWTWCAVILSAVAARAEVVVGHGPIEANPAHEIIDVDLDGDGQPDLTIITGVGSVAPDTGFAGEHAATGSDLMFTAALTPGTVIGPSSTFTADGPEAYANSSINVFSASFDGIYGLKFTSGGRSHYGWAHLTGEVSLQNNDARLTLSQWAYESQAGSSIVAGAVVPEPATLALLLPVIAGLLLRRRP